MQTVWDAIVIGGGPAGYTAAIRLGQLGKEALVVEREAFGGVCLNWGCIPTKALVHAAATVQGMREAEALGIRVNAPSIDFARTQAWKDGIVERLTSNVATLVRANGGTTLEGEARLVAPDRVEIRDRNGGVTTHVAREAIVVATGASVATLPGFAPDGSRILTAREAVSLAEVPESLLVIGGGVIGLELGMMYQRLGTKLTVVELTDGLLPGLDRDLARVVERRLRARGGTVLTGAAARGWEERGGRAVVRVERAGEALDLEAERVLVSVGFRPASRGFGLEELGVALDARGHVVVDDRMRSSVPGIYAIGDVAGAPYLAHKAYREAELAAEVIAGRNVRRGWLALPAAIFTDPEIAVVGMGEAEARAAGLAVRVGRFPFSASGRALSLGETEGFVKVVADEERVLGVGIVGPDSSELIAEAAFAIEMMASLEDVALTIHTHPTLGEGVAEAFKHALGEATHILNRPARVEVAA